MISLKSSVSRVAVACALALSSAPVLAGSFDIPNGTVVGTEQRLTGTQTGTIAVGGWLSSPDNGVVLGAATGTGVVLTNDGTINAGDRAIDTTNGVTGRLTVINSGEVTSFDDTFRLRGGFANGTLTLTNNYLMSTGDGQVLDFNGATAASAVVTIDNTGTMRANDGASDAIRLGGGIISLTNSGTIEALSDDKRAISLDTDTNVDTLVSLEINNLAGGLISSGDDAIKIKATDTTTSTAVITINNAGTIRATGEGQGIDLGAIVTTGMTITVTNEATGVISAADNDGIRGGMNTTVHNYGQITATYTTVSADDQNHSGIRFDGGSGTIYNYAGGTITGSYHGIKASGATDDIQVYNWGTIVGDNGSGVNSNGTATVINHGTITGKSDPLAAFGDADGVDIDTIGTIINYGTIEALGSRGTKPGETRPSTSEGIAIGGGDITNGSATARTARISGGNNGILADDSNRGSVFGALTVTNYGTIEGNDGYGIQVINDAGYVTTITNYGTISGTTYAVAMGNGDDLFVYQAGSSVIGEVRGEGGTDTLRLGEVAGTFNLALLGETATYQNFEILDLTAGANWTLTGTSDFAGATRVTDAGLTLNNAGLASSVVTIAGTSPGRAILAGTGTIGGLNVGPEGTVAPGLGTTSIGTLNVAGNASFQNRSIYAVSVTNTGASDRIAATGTATLNPGATLAVEAAYGTYNFSQNYTVLTAAGGVTGTFDTVTSNLAFLTPSLSYDTNSVSLTLDRNNVSFASLAYTPNSRAAAGAVEAGGTGTALYGAVVTGTLASSQSAFELLAGEAFASNGATLANQNQMVGDIIDSRLRQAGYAGTSGSAGSLGFGGPTSYAAAPVVKAGPFSSAIPAVTGPVWTGWAQGFGQWNSTSGDGNAYGMDSTVGGVLAGLDVTHNNVTVGFALGYSSAKSSVAETASTQDTDTFQLALYAGTSFGALKLRGGANVGWTSTDSERRVVVGTLTERPTASYDGLTGSVFGEVGYALPVGPVAFEPFAAIAWNAVETDGFTERNAPVTGLTSGGLSFDTWSSTLGVRAAGSFTLNGLNLTPHASLGWRHAFGDVTPVVAMTFLNTGTGFSVEGLPIAKDSALVGAGLDLALGNGITLGVSYDGAFASDATSNAVRGTASIAF
ncbi:autotransporter domain-containing protein [Xanthobacteraceae bacterium A53D]